MNHQDWQYWKDRYLDKINSNDDAIVAINSMLASLDDPYSVFMNAEDFKEQLNSEKSYTRSLRNDIVDLKRQIYEKDEIIDKFSAAIGILKFGITAPFAVADGIADSEISALRHLNKENEELKNKNITRISSSTPFLIFMFISTASCLILNSQKS